MHKRSAELRTTGYKLMSNIVFKDITLERILESCNLMEALKKVESNGGAPGVDGMETSELRDYIYAHPGELRASLLTGSYRPCPIRRVYIPKDNGEMRPLGIPTVLDRLVQQAIAQVLSEEYEKVFSKNSFGYRPNRGAHDAVNRALSYLNDGYEWVIDLDLSKFFDTVNHSKLLQLLSDRIKDGRVISLIHRFLRAPVCENGKVGHATQIGTPQGGCISPILANIILNECDQLLDSRGIRFARYADDMVIMCGSRKAAERILQNVTKFLEGKLFLKVNKEKTKIGKASTKTQFLGFAFTTTATKARGAGNILGPRWFLTVHQKKRSKFCLSVREILDRRCKGGFQRVKLKLRWKVQGWVSYFGNAIPVSWLKSVDAWMRRRIRQMYWKQWKTPQNRAKNCQERAPWNKGLPTLACSSNRYWRMSKNHVINDVLSNKQLVAEGWASLQDTLKDRALNHPIR